VKLCRRLGEFEANGPVRLPLPDGATYQAISRARVHVQARADDDVAYQSLLLDHRRLLHGRIVEAVELLFADRLPEWIDRLTHHAVRAAAWEKAFGYLQQAAAKAMTRSAYREAAAYFEQSLDAARHLPQDQCLLERRSICGSTHPPIRGRAYRICRD